MAQIIPNAPKYRRREKAISYQKAATTGNRRFDPELRLMQKAANERLRQLEKQGIKSPAYNALQAKLEILGKERKGQRGRRFSETGKGTYNEREMQKKILNEFLHQKTSSISGAKDYYDRVWETANKDGKLTNAGISREQWFDFFDSLPDSKKDRMYYSQQVKIFKAFMRKNGELVDEGKITVEQIANAIQEADKLNEAFSDLNSLVMNERIKDGMSEAQKEKIEDKYSISIGEI